MNAIEWLGRWEDIQSPGKHTRVVPAYNAKGYQFVPPSYSGSRVPKSETPYSMWDRVSRAIPVDGTISDAPPSWERSPQVRRWLVKEKAPIRARIMAWLKKPANK